MWKQLLCRAHLPLCRNHYCVENICCYVQTVMSVKELCDAPLVANAACSMKTGSSCRTSNRNLYFALHSHPLFNHKHVGTHVKGHFTKSITPYVTRNQWVKHRLHIHMSITVMISLPAHSNGTHAPRRAILTSTWEITSWTINKVITTSEPGEIYRYTILSKYVYFA